jgi:hypothetical protein
MRVGDFMSGQGLIASGRFSEISRSATGVLAFVNGLARAVAGRSRA